MLFIPFLPISVTLSVILTMQTAGSFRVKILLLKFMHPLLSLQYFILQPQLYHCACYLLLSSPFTPFMFSASVLLL